MPTMPISEEARTVIIHTLRSHGAYALAARNAGITYSHLRSIMARFPEFAEQVEDAVAEHRDALLLMAQQRATQSDSVLIKLLEANRPEFTPEGRKHAQLQTGRIGAVKLRSFDEDGQEVHTPEDATPSAPQLLTLESKL